MPAGDAPLDLGRFDLELARLVRLLGQPAPPLDVVAWSDGKTRTLTELRGRPVVLCFWQKQTSADELRSIFDLHRRLQGTDAQLLLIHGPQVDGLPEVRRYLLEDVKPKDADASVEYDLTKWPFPTAVDRFLEEPNRWGGGPGRTEKRYGDFAPPLFVLIGRDGKIVANSRLKRPDFEAELEKLLR